MIKTYIEMDDALSAVESLAERAKVMVEDVQQGYFNQDIKTGGNRILTLAYYDTASIKADIANDILFDLLNRLIELRALMDKEWEIGKEGAAV